MAIYKDEAAGTWRVIFRYTDWTGARKQTQKRGFATKKDAQLSAIFNHAKRYYGLQQNPAQQAGRIGKEVPKEMNFWTKEEYLKFADAMMDKPVSWRKVLKYLKLLRTFPACVFMQTG